MDVWDKSISKRETDGQDFPRNEKFERLTIALDAIVEDIFSGSKDGLKISC